MKKILAVLLSALMVFTLVGCSNGTSDAGDDAAADKQLVGVSMPTKSLQRWIQDGDNMKSKLEAAGYEVDLQYAGDNDITMQVSQIENMVAEGCKVLVIAAIEGDSLGTVLAQAKEAGVTVIAYDRLIMNTDAVNYYATFDNYKVGTLQGTFVKNALDLDNAEGPFNIEFQAGDPGDNNAGFFFNGAYDVLKPYIESGKLVCVSGQTAFADVATAGWATDVAQARAENILNSYYADGTQLDAFCCSNDSTALGTINALIANYYDTHDNIPVVTGQDGDLANVPYIQDGREGMAVFKDTRTLAAKVVEMVNAIMSGAEVPVNDTKTYDNGTGIIPSFLCDPIECTKDNWKEVLIDSGYYKLDGDKVVANN